MRRKTGFFTMVANLCPLLFLVAMATGWAQSSRDALAPVRASLVPERGSWLDVEGNALSFQSDEEILEFLSTARVVSSKGIGEGINGVRKVLLEKDGVRAHSAFRAVTVEKHFMRMANGITKLNFRDDCRFELVAYRLSRLLGLDNVPPVVERRVNRRPGTLQIWVENAMMEKKRWKEGIQPPNKLIWSYQWQIIHIFDNLIYNEDRNLGNILIDSQWKLWMIDHTRAFRRHTELRSPEQIRFCSRTLWETLKRLDLKLLEKEFDGILKTTEMEALLKRRDLIVQHLQTLMQDRNPGSVLF